MLPVKPINLWGNISHLSVHLRSSSQPQAEKNLQFSNFM